MRRDSFSLEINENNEETPPPQYLTPRDNHLRSSMPSILASDDGQSYSLRSQTDVTLTSEDHAKLKTIVNKLFGTQQYEDDKKTFTKMMDQVDDEVDKHPNYVEGIFYINKYSFKDMCLCRSKKPKSIADKICVYDSNSLYIFSHKRCLRKFLVAVTESYAFEQTNNCIIVMATVCMLMTDPLDPNNETHWNQQLDLVTYVIVYLFTFEMLLKVAAQGLFMHPNSYLRDPWNLIDLAVVVTGIIERTPNSDIQLTGMRPLRVLRTLRSIKTFPNMRRLIQGMIDSVPSLFYAVVFMAFVYLQFAIFGTQQFGGDYYQRCRYDPGPPLQGAWAYSDERLCSVVEDTGYQCPGDQTCGQWPDSLIDMEQIDYGFTNFDNIYNSLFTIFQCITLEGWTVIMHNLMDIESPNWVVPTFFVCLVILGSLFLINVVLAIFGDSLEKQENIRQIQENEQKKRIAQSVKRQKAQNPSTIVKPDSVDVSVEVTLVSAPDADKQLQTQKSIQVADETNITIEEPFKTQTTPTSVQDTQHMTVLTGERIKLTIPKRAAQNVVYKRCFILCNRPGFQFFISSMIIINFFILAFDRYPVSAQEVVITDNINNAISFVFLFEMIVKLLGYGPKEYARDRFNLFEAMIVCISMVELSLFYVNGNKGALTVFRAIRILRMFKLSRKWKAFTLIFNKILESINDISYFLVLMTIFIVVFTILGMQFFAATVYLDADGHLTTADLGVVPANNFDSVYNAFVTVFAVTIGDDWNRIYYNYARYNANLAAFYFVTLTTITNIVLLNLFLALLLQNFQQPLKTSGDQDIDIGGLMILKTRLLQKCRKIIEFVFEKCCKIQMPQTEAVSESESEETVKRKSLNQEIAFYQERLNTGNLFLVQSMQAKNKDFIRVSDLNTQETKKEANTHSIASIVKADLLTFVKQKSNIIILEGNSLFCLRRTNRFRQMVANIVCNKHFDNFTILAILVSTINLSLDSPLNDPNSTQTIVIYHIDIAISCIFALEAIIKIIVFGLLFNGKQSYLRSLWNIIDFMTVVTSTISLATPSSDDNLSFFKILRVVRFLRPLRIIQKNQGLKIAVQSLINALPGILNLTIICCSLLTIFSILGVNLFKGGFYTCDMTNIPTDVQDKIQTLWDCQDYGGEWINYQYNFDNLLQAFKTQFCIMTTEGWFGVYQMAYNFTESYYAMPIAGSSPSSIIYFIVCLFVSSLFILNMFVGVVISTFNIEKEKLNHNTHLTKLESEYIDTCMLCYKTKPVAAFQKSGYWIKDKMRLLVLHKAFDIVIFICILINSVILMLTWYNQNPRVRFVLDVINDCLSLVFTVECVCKLIGFGFNYFKSIWNHVDFFVVITSIIDFTVMQTTSFQGNSSLKIIRTFRVVRILKLMRRFKEMQRILNTFIQAIPALLNVGGLLFLFLYLYAVGAVYFFSNVKLQSALNENANFQSFGLALLTLFSMSTGEGWNDIMEDCARSRSLDFLCYVQTYEQQQAEGIQGCGSPIASYLFFCSFMVFITFIMLNLFIAIILEAFERQLAEEAQTIQPETMEEFILLWKEQDPTASGFIETSKLETLIMKLLEREQHLRKLRPNSQDVLFNLNECRLLRLYKAWQQQHDDGSSQFKDLRNSVRMQRLLGVHMGRWLGGLMIPTYNKVQQYYFHDVLVALVTFFFSQKHKDAYQQRKQRIEDLIQTGQKLTLFDQVFTDKKLFDKLSKFDQMRYNEVNSERFADVIESIEIKGKRRVKVIGRLQSMLEMRRKISLKNAKFLDDFGDIVINSNHVVAARIITKFIFQKNLEIKKRKERRRAAMQLNIHNTKFLNLVPERQELRRLKQVTSKQFQKYHIEEVINRNRNIQQNLSSSDGSSPSSNSSSRSSHTGNQRPSDYLTHPRLSEQPPLRDIEIESMSSSSSSQQQESNERPMIVVQPLQSAQLVGNEMLSSQSERSAPNESTSHGLQMEVEFQDLILGKARHSKHQSNKLSATEQIFGGKRTLFNLPIVTKRMD